MIDSNLINKEKVIELYHSEEKKSHRRFVHKWPSRYKQHLYTSFTQDVKLGKPAIPHYWKNCHEETPENARTVLQNLIIPSVIKTRYYWERYTDLNEDQLKDLG